MFISMKKLVLGAFSALLAVSCVAQPFIIKGSGKSVKGEFDITLDYTSLSVQQGITVVFFTSETGVGQISADEKVFEYVSVSENSGDVKVSYLPHVNLRFGAETIVRMPLSRNLKYIEASSAGRVESESVLKYPSLSIDGSSAANLHFDVDVKTLTVDLSSAAQFDGNVTADDLDVDLSSAAGCKVTGKSGHLGVQTSSAGSFKGYDLVCEVADVRASSGSSVHTTVTKELAADVSSGASVRYKGSPRDIRPDVSSGGSLKNAE
jgi:hypothetical protein